MIFTFIVLASFRWAKEVPGYLERKIGVALKRAPRTKRLSRMAFRAIGYPYDATAILLNSALLCNLSESI